MSTQLQRNKRNTHKLTVVFPIKSTPRGWLGPKCVPCWHQDLNLVPFAERPSIAAHTHSQSWRWRGGRTAQHACWPLSLV